MLEQTQTVETIDQSPVKEVQPQKRNLYAAQIVCICQKRLAIVEVRMVNTACCSNCGRQYMMSKVTQEE